MTRVSVSKCAFVPELYCTRRKYLAVISFFPQEQANKAIAMVNSIILFFITDGL